MAFDYEWWLGFGAGILLFSGIVLAAMIQVRHLLASSIPTASSDGTNPRLGRWRIALMILLLALKTFGAGVVIYFILVVWRLPLTAFALGLFVGLGAMALVGVLGPRFRVEKKKKNH